MPTRGGDLCLRILDREGSTANGNPQSLKACFELETGNLEHLGRLSETDSLVQVVTEHPGFKRITKPPGASTGNEKGEDPQNPIIQGIQKDDTLLPSTRNDGKLSLLDPIQDLSGPLGQVGGEIMVRVIGAPSRTAERTWNEIELASDGRCLAAGRSWNVHEEPVMNELIFIVEEAPEGGYTARALGESIFTEADDLTQLQEQVRDAVLCHFDDEEARPKLVRLHLVREQLIAV